MDLHAEVVAPCRPDQLWTWVDDLARYPSWLEIVTRAAVAAISRGEDRITGATLSGLSYVPLSRRRNSALRHEMT